MNILYERIKNIYLSLFFLSPKLLSSGIYEAMLTTAAGLFVGIIAYLSYNYLVSRVEKLIHKMEYTTIEFIETLQSKKWI